MTSLQFSCANKEKVITSYLYLCALNAEVYNSSLLKRMLNNLNKYLSLHAAPHNSAIKLNF